MRIRTLICLVAAVPFQLANAASMRCGKWVVDEAATVADLLEKCGEPASKDISAEDVIAHNAATGTRVKVGTTVKERWLYRRGTQSLPMRVTIVDGKITRIERAE